MIVLIHPPMAKAGEPPAGIALLAGALRRRNIPCTLWDANLEGQLSLLDREIEPTDTWSRRALRYRDEHLAALRDPALYSSPDRYRRTVIDVNRGLELAARSHPNIHLSLANLQDKGCNPLDSRDLLLAAE